MHTSRWRTAFTTRTASCIFQPVFASHSRGMCRSGSPFLRSSAVCGDGVVETRGVDEHRRGTIWRTNCVQILTTLYHTAAKTKDGRIEQYKDSGQ